MPTEGSSIHVSPLKKSTQKTVNFLVLHLKVEIESIHSGYKKEESDISTRVSSFKKLDTIKLKVLSTISLSLQAEAGY